MTITGDIRHESVWCLLDPLKKTCNMKSPWENINRAFEPFYADVAVVTFERNNVVDRQTLNVCVFNDMDGEPLAENSIETTREDILIHCKRCDWSIIKKFRRGDEVQIQSRENVVYTFSEVINDFHFGIVVKAREKRR